MRRSLKIGCLAFIVVLIAGSIGAIYLSGRTQLERAERIIETVYMDTSLNYLKPDVTVAQLDTGRQEAQALNDVPFIKSKEVGLMQLKADTAWYKYEANLVLNTLFDIEGPFIYGDRMVQAPALRRTLTQGDIDRAEPVIERVAHLGDSFSQTIVEAFNYAKKAVEIRQQATERLSPYLVTKTPESAAVVDNMEQAIAPYKEEYMMKDVVNLLYAVRAFQQSGDGIPEPVEPTYDPYS